MNLHVGTPVDQMFAAIGQGDAGAVDSLVSTNPALLESRSSADMRPTTLAIYSGATAVLDVLRRHGAQLDIFDAAALGDLERLRDCLAQDPRSIDHYSADGWTALHLAGHFDQPEVAMLLLDAGAPVNARSHNRNGNTPLHAALAGRAVRTTTLLIQRGADVNVADAAGYTPLHLAAHEGNLDLVRLLLDGGADRTAQRPNGDTPADVAASEGHPKVAGLLHT